MRSYRFAGFGDDACACLAGLPAADAGRAGIEFRHLVADLRPAPTTMTVEAPALGGPGRRNHRTFVKSRSLWTNGSGASSARLHQPGIVRGDRGLKAIAHAELAQHALHVTFHRGLRQVELRADLGV